MRLLRLYSNQPQFREVVFNRTGLTVIVGSKGESIEKGISTNGVGKSLIIKLIHYCLGSNSVKDFETKLAAYTFFLEVEINNSNYTFERSASTVGKKQITVNGREQSLSDFKDWLGRILFNLNEETGSLSFRSLISRFIRPNIAAYAKYDKFVEGEKPAVQLLNNAYLLGLSPKLILQKQAIKEEWQKTKTLRDTLNADKTLTIFLASKSKVSIEITISNLEANIKILETRLQNLRIAENYTEMTQEWNNVKYQLAQKINDIGLQKMGLANLKKSLEKRPSLSNVEVAKMYEDANIQLSDMVKKRLEEVQIFNQKIIVDRERRLNEEQKRIENIIKNIQKEITALEERDDDFRVKLTNKSSFDDYNAVNNDLTEKKLTLQRLQVYKKMTYGYDDFLLTKEIEMKQTVGKALQYINDEAKETISENSTFFMYFAQQIFEDLPTSGISVKHNEGDKNQIAFDISADIQGANSDGTNDALTFCFDWTLLHFKHNHNIEFLVHDSRITDHLSTAEQRLKMIELSYNQAKKDGVQYILGMNEENWENALSQIEDENFKDELRKAVTIKLTFKNLLLGGPHINLDYEA